VAKSRRKRQQRRRPPATRPTSPPPARADADAEFERLAELALAEARRRAQEALSPDTPPERVAALVVEEFEDLPAPAGLAMRLRREGSEERARAVAAEVERLAPASVTALTLAAELAAVLGHDRERAGALLEQALDAVPRLEGNVGLARHMLVCGRWLDAIRLVREVLLDDPEDEDAQEVYGRALEELDERRAAGERLEREEREELERFADRAQMYALRDAMRMLVEERRPQLQVVIAESVRAWLDQHREAASGEDDGGLGPEEDGEHSETLLRFAIEHAWLLDDDLDEDEREPTARETEGEAPLALLVGDRGVSHEIRAAAQEWLDTVSYGLWQIEDPAPAPGLWLTDVVTGVRRYAAIPPEQLGGMSRWSVLLGALVALDGIWRTTGAIVLLRPSEGDDAADWVNQAGVALARELAGKRARRPARRREPEPHGVLVALEEPADPDAAALMSKVLGSLLPAIVGEMGRRRAAGPTLTNTDGHRLALITVRIVVNDPPAVAAKLGGHADFRLDDNGELTWWGRELTAMERESSLAQLRSIAGERAPAEEPAEPQRWLRGQLEQHPGGFEASVNSQERLDALVDLLEELGAEPALERKTVIDPTQDMPPIALGGPMPFGGSREAVETWESLWPDERVPGLGGTTPRAASQRTTTRPRLEAILREFEHDAHLLAQSGAPAPDLTRLRAELGMERWWEQPAHAPARAPSR
jgi:tetratricopeptide (TPR) repeat protein